MSVLTPDERRAAQVVVAAMLGDLEDPGVNRTLVAMMQDLYDEDPTLPHVGAAVVNGALLDVIEEELGVPRDEILRRLARGLAS